MTHPTRPLGRVAGRASALVALGLAGLSLGGCVVTPTASAGAAPGYGYTCYAGVYVCRVPQQIPVGTRCSCPGIGAPSFGRIS